MSRLTRTLPRFAAVLLGVAAAVQAAELPEWYPQEFDAVGRVQRIDRVGGEMVAGDRYFRIARDAQVHSLNTPDDTLLSVQEGTLLGVRAYRLENGQRLMTEAWILPGTYTPPEADEE